MTLIVTYAGPLGVVMAADSTITQFQAARVKHVDQKGWKKIVCAPNARGAISYWGMVGLIRTRFDLWLEYLVTNKYAAVTNLIDLADAITNEFNQAFDNQPVPHPTGMHVAGWWSNGASPPRPTIFHIHNGHGHYGVNHATGDWGFIESEPRRLFQVHQDFLQGIGGTEFQLRNGDFMLFAEVFCELSTAVARVNLLKGIRIPKANTLGAIKGYVHALVKIIVELYRVSSLYPTIGGKVISVGIGPGKTPFLR